MTVSYYDLTTGELVKGLNLEKIPTFAKTDLPPTLVPVPPNAVRVYYTIVEEDKVKNYVVEINFERAKPAI